MRIITEIGNVVFVTCEIKHSCSEAGARNLPASRKRSTTPAESYSPQQRLRRPWTSSWTWPALWCLQNRTFSTEM